MNILNKSICKCHCEPGEAIQPLEIALGYRPRNDHVRLSYTDNKGAAALEFGLLLPLLIVIIFGIIEFGVLLYDRQVITNASREGARCGIIQQTPRITDSEIEDVVNDYCKDHLITFGSGGDPVTTVTREGLSFSDDLTVRVEYHYDFLVLPNFIGSLVGGTDLVAQTVMRME